LGNYVYCAMYFLEITKKCFNNIGDTGVIHKILIND